MTGPEYKNPEVPVPGKWSESLEGGEKDGSPNLVHWWSEFSDATLESLVTRATQSNLDLRIAESRIREARASLRMTQADLWPQLNAAGSYQRTQSKKSPSVSGANGKPGASITLSQQGVSVTATPAGATGPSIAFVPDLSGGGNSSLTLSSGAGASGAKTKRQGDLFQAGFDASWEIDVFGGARRAKEAAKADVEAAQENRRSVLVTLVAEIARNYFELRETQNRLDIARRNIRILQDSLDLVRSRFEAGLTNELDVATAEAQLATSQSSVPNLEAAVKRSVHRLGVLLGHEPGTLQDELSPVSPLPSAPPEVLVGLPSELLRRRPDVRYAERTLAAATARIGVATADLFPKFSLTGSFGGSSDTFEGLRLGANHTWSFGPEIRWPIFDAGRIRANIRVQNARQEQALLAYEKAVMISLEDVENALVMYAKEQNRLADLATAVEANHKALDIANDLYAQGLVNFLNVLDAERALFAAEDQFIQSKATILTGLVSLYKALGGGWEARTASAALVAQEANANRSRTHDDQSKH
jgi:NodT family efflux transporter outer membrane factor (OMF) lipoprotein